MTIRVLLADDQALIRAGFRMIIDAEPGFEVVAEAADGREALDLARTARADVVLMDIRMPHMDGLEATRRIGADDDLAGVRVLVLTTFENDDNVVLALQAGEQLDPGGLGVEGRLADRPIRGRGRNGEAHGGAKQRTDLHGRHGRLLR